MLSRGQDIEPLTDLYNSIVTLMCIYDDAVVDDCDDLSEESTPTFQKILSEFDDIDEGK